MANSNTLHSKKVRAANADKWNKDKKKVLSICFYDNNALVVEAFKDEAKMKNLSYIQLLKEKMNK